MIVREQLEEVLDRIRDYRCKALDGEETPCLYFSPRDAAIYWKGQIVQLQTVLLLLDE